MQTPQLTFVQSFCFGFFILFLVLDPVSKEFKALIQCFAFYCKMTVIDDTLSSAKS